MTIKESYDKFIYSKRLAGLTKNSIDSYNDHTIGFISYVGFELPLNCLTREHIDNYIESLLNRNISKATLSSYVRDTKIFVVWLENNYSVDLSAKTIIVPKMPKTSPRIYSDDDIALIMKSIVAESEWLTVRNRCMITLMYDSGLRQSEVCTLKKIDVDFTANNMRVHGKGNKERIVPLGAYSKRYMQEYMALCPYSSEYVFIGRRGEKVTTNSLKLLVSKIAKNLPFEFSCHKLRHNFATNYCIDQHEAHHNIDIYSLKALMGHESIETTERYLHLAMEILASRQHISHFDKIMANMA